MSGSPKNATETDRLIGARIREARKAMKLSQTALADRLGITFQQVQKYERAHNRVAASRLVEIAAVLNRPVADFLPEGA